MGTLTPSQRRSITQRTGAIVHLDGEKGIVTGHYDDDIVFVNFGRVPEACYTDGLEFVATDATGLIQKRGGGLTMRNDVSALAADIREANSGQKLGTAELAEKLVERGWVKPNPSIEPEYPKYDGDMLVLGPEIFTGGPGNEDRRIISWRGKNYIKQNNQ